MVSTLEARTYVFQVESGKLMRMYDDSLEAIRKGGPQFIGLEKTDMDLDFGRRLDVEKGIQQQGYDGPVSNALFDETGDFLFLPFLGGKCCHCV